MVCVTVRLVLGACLVPTEVKVVPDPLELEKQLVISCNVNAGNRTHVVWKNKRFLMFESSLPLSVVGFAAAFYVSRGYHLRKIQQS